MSEFNIEVGVSLNREQFERQFANFRKEYTNSVSRLEDGTVQVKSFAKYINEAGESFVHLKTKVVGANRQLIETQNEIIKVSEGFQLMSGATQQVGNSANGINALVGSLTKSSNAISQNNAEVSSTVKSYSEWLSTLGVVSREEVENNNATTQLTTGQNALTRAIAESLGVSEQQVLAQQQIAKTNKEVDASNKQKENTTKKTVTAQNQLAEANRNVVTSGQQVVGVNRSITNSNRSLGQSFFDVVKKVTKFYVATMPIQMFRKAISETISVVKEFDDAVTELSKVSSLSGESMSAYTEKLGKLGETVARTRTEMVQSATEFKKAGFSEEDSAQLAQLSSLYQNTADEELSASEATSVLVSQMKAFNYTAEDAIHITDAINKVSQDFAVSSADIGKGLTQAGASLQTYGNSFDQTVGLLTAGTEIFQGKSQQVARGLNQIANRISKNEDALGEYGVRVKDINGNLRSTFDVLRDLKPKWDEMSNTEQVALGTALAGTNQYKIFSAVMSNFETAIESADESLNSAGTTMKQNEVYMQSMEAKLQGLKTEFEKLVLGENGLLVKFAKSMIDISKAVLEFANSDAGKLLIKLTAIAVGVVALQKGLTSLIGVIKLVKDAFIVATACGEGFLGVLTLLEINPIVLAVTALIGVVVGAKAIYDKYNVTLEEHMEILSKLKGEYEQIEGEMGTVESKLERVNEKIKELRSMGKLSLTDQQDLVNLRIEREELQKQLDVLKERQALKQQEIDAEFETTANKREVTNYYASNEKGAYLGYDEWQTANGISDTLAGALADATAEMDKQYAIVERLSNKQESYVGLTQAESKELEEATRIYEEARARASQYYEDLSTSMEGVSENAKGFAEAKEASDAYKDSIHNRTEESKEYMGELDEETDALEENTDATKDALPSLEDMAKNLNMTEEALKDYADSLGISVEDTYKYLSQMNNVIGDMDDLSSAYSTLKKAVEEYNSTGQYSLETYKALMKLKPEYLNALESENGKLKINEESLKNTSQALINNAKAVLVQKTEAQIAEIVNRYYSQTLDDVSTSSETVSEKVETAGQKAKQSGEDAREGGKGWVDFWNDMTRDTKVVNKEMQNEIDEVKKSFKEEFELIDKIGDNYYKTTNAVTKGASKQKDAVNSVTSALDKQISVLKKQKDEAIKAVDAQIKALKKQKEEAVKAIEAQIKALQKEKEARQKYWEEQLKNLERENEERERGLELQKKQEELARAMQNRKMIFQDGEFQYGLDETEVSQAQQGLFELEDKNEYEKQKQLLEDLRDAEMEMYEQRIQTLEEYKEQVEEFYDQQIEALEEYKEQLEEEYDAQIENLEYLKENITEIYDSLSEEEKAIFDEMLASEAGYQKLSLIQWGQFAKDLDGVGKQIADAMGKAIAGEPNGGGNYGSGSLIPFKSTGDNSIGAYASGKGSIGDTQLAVVGENPKYREIIIGSKLNHDQGVLMSLKRGTGVVNAGATNTLASLFHQLGGNKQLNTRNISNGGTTISINNITLPEVKNGSDFVEYLQNFALDMTQKAYAR